MNENDKSHHRAQTLAAITTAGNGLPNRVILYGPEGVGKTSFAACAPKPVFVMTKGESGLLTLINAGRVPETPHWPELATWQQLLDVVDTLTHQEHDYRTLVIDTINGAERLCHSAVCRRDFGGDWGRNGFTAFMTGYEVSVADWQALLDALDELRARRRMSILALAHHRVFTFKNPEGTDYDRYIVDLHTKTWTPTQRWADMVLFNNFVAHVEAGRGEEKGKARGGSRRVLYTARTAAFDAKNRHGLPAQIDAGRSASEAWSNFAAALQAARNQEQQPPADGPQADSSNTK